MTWVIFLWSLPLLVLPLLITTDATLSELGDLNRARARALADYGLGRALTRLVENPAYQGGFTEVVPEGKVIIAVVGSGDAREVETVAYVPGVLNPLAVARVHAHVERTAPSPTWTIVGGKQITEGFQASQFAEQ